MAISGGGSSNDEIIGVEIDAVFENATDPVEIGALGKVGIFVSNKDEVAFTGVVTVQISPDEENWFDTPHTVTGPGCLHDITAISDFARGKITTKGADGSSVIISIITR